MTIVIVVVVVVKKREILKKRPAFLDFLLFRVGGMSFLLAFEGSLHCCPVLSSNQTRDHDFFT